MWSEVLVILYLGFSMDKEFSASKLCFEFKTKSKVIIYWRFKFHNESKLNSLWIFNLISIQRIKEENLTKFHLEFTAAVAFNERIKYFADCQLVWYGRMLGRFLARKWKNRPSNRKTRRFEQAYLSWIVRSANNLA